MRGGKQGSHLYFKVNILETEVIGIALTPTPPLGKWHHHPEPETWLFDSALFLIPTPNQVTTSFPFCLVSMSLIQLFLSITPVHTLAGATALSHLDYCIRLQTESPALAPVHCDQTL